jgi:hypothetical protein
LGIPSGKHGAVAVIQRANSDLRCNPHVHAIFLDGMYAPDRDGKGSAAGGVKSANLLRGRGAGRGLPFQNV